MRVGALVLLSLGLAGGVGCTESEPTPDAAGQIDAATPAAPPELPAVAEAKTCEPLGGANSANMHLLSKDGPETETTNLRLDFQTGHLSGFVHKGDDKSAARQEIDVFVPNGVREEAKKVLASICKVRESFPDEAEMAREHAGEDPAELDAWGLPASATKGHGQGVGRNTSIWVSDKDGDYVAVARNTRGFPVITNYALVDKQEWRALLGLWPIDLKTAEVTLGKHADVAADAAQTPAQFERAPAP